MMDITRKASRIAGVLAIHVQVADARRPRRIESRLSKLLNIVTQIYLRAVDKSDFYQIRTAN